ncbi:MAG: OmpH family outer membrane protein [Candidatus Omnitrophota bacterium]
MRRLFFLISLIILVFSLSAYAKEMKTGVVDLFAVFDNYNKTKDYEKALEEEKENKIKENKLSEKKEEIMKMQDKLELLKDKEKEKQREKIQEALIEYKSLENEVMSSLKREGDEKMKDIFEDVQNRIDDYAKTNGFSVILNKNALLYSQEDLDLTEVIIKQLNDQYKKE